MFHLEFAPTVLSDYKASRAGGPVPMTPRFLRVYDGFLAPDECAALVRHFQARTADEVTEIDNGLAKYRRHVMIDSVLAARVFEAVRAELPAELGAVCANDHFRFSEYSPGGEFKMHRDGVNQDARGNRSVVTVNVFLNDDFSGGATDFFFDDKRLRASVPPAPGRAAVFLADQYHCGRPVTRGRKYLLRTDIMTRDLGSVYTWVRQHALAP
jgi:prolyl 4-hydroxylase